MAQEREWSQIEDLVGREMPLWLRLICVSILIFGVAALLGYLLYSMGIIGWQEFWVYR